jgi:hypothetical protein
MTRRELAVVGAAVAVYLLILGALIGIITQRIRLDLIRGQLLWRLEAATRARGADLTSLERDEETLSALPGTPRLLDGIDRALQLNDIVGAERAWRAAYVVATRSRGWRAFADLGDAALRIGDAAGQRGSYVPRAREAYFAALVRARADRSREGVTRMHHAFRVLGDHELAQQCAIIAEQLPARDVDTTSIKGQSKSAGGTHGSIRDR